MPGLRIVESRLARRGVELVTASTITNVAEAIRTTRAALRVQIPVVVSFAVNTDAHLQTGYPLREAIELVDAATRTGPAYYRVNCAHPDQLEAALTPGSRPGRLKGIRSTVLRGSHTGLDASSTLDDGDLQVLAGAYAALGGRCGINRRHVAAITKSFKQPGLRRLASRLREEAPAITVGALAFLLFAYLMYTRHYAIEYPTVT